MWIRKLIIEGYKKFTPKLEIIFDREINLLIGINGSGKSSVLEAIVVLFAELYKYTQSGKPTEKPFLFSIDYSFVSKGETTSIDLVQFSNSVENLLFSSYVNEVPLEKPQDIYKYLPDNIICYYSGECNTLKKLVAEIELSQAKKFKKLVAEIEGNTLFEVLSKQFIYIKDYHFSLLFLVQNLTYSDFKLPLSNDVYSFQNVRIFFNPPTIYRATKSIEDYYGLQGVLKDYLQAFLSYTNMPKTDENKRLYVDVLSNYYFLNGLEELGSNAQTIYVENEDYLLFHILNLLFRIGIIDEIEIIVRRETDEKIFNIQEFSEGEQQLITISAIKSILLKDNSLLLLDEPDAYLHPKRQREFISHLKEINDDGFNQIIMTSHSPFVAQSIELEHIRVLNDNGELIKDLESTLDYKAITNELFGIKERFSTNIEEELNKFKSIRDDIMQDKKIDKKALKSIVSHIDSFGEETSLIINRELAQLKTLKQFEL